MNITSLNLLKDEISQYNDFEDFKKYIGFLDIETTGLDKTRHYITLVGVYNNKVPKVFVRGKDLDKSKEEIEKHKYVLTFNGIRFDIPFLEHHLNIDKKFKQIDIMYLLRELGYRGGLKRIEQELGIVRHNDVLHTTGKDAVSLWYDYLEGSKDALQKLILYNMEDIVNLEVLLNFVYYKSLDYIVTERHINMWRKELFDAL